MKNLSSYIENRLQDIDRSLNDDFISDSDRSYLLGQKDELLSVKNIFIEGK